MSAKAHHPAEGRSPPGGVGGAADGSDRSVRPGAWRRVVKWIGDALEPDANPAGAIYGTITAGALLAAESARQETTPDALGAVVLALLVYWLAHAYADALGDRLEADKRFCLSALAYQLRRSATILRGSTLPVGAMVVAWAAGADTHQTVLIALFAAAVSLVLLELIAAVRSQSSRREILTQVAVSAVLGLGILAMKVVLH